MQGRDNYLIMTMMITIIVLLNQTLTGWMLLNGDHALQVRIQAQCLDQPSTSSHDSGSSPEVSAGSMPRKDQVLQSQQLSFHNEKKDDKGKSRQGDASLNNDGA